MELLSKMDDTIKNLKKAGLKVTPQRVIVYRCLKKLGHSRPEIIFEKAKRQLPTISLATVYSTLNTFTKHGLITKIIVKDNLQFFDITIYPHAHFVCIECFEIHDAITYNSPYSPQLPLIANKILSLNIVFYGICKNCATIKKRRGKDDKTRTNLQM